MGQRAAAHQQHRPGVVALGAHNPQQGAQHRALAHQTNHGEQQQKSNLPAGKVTHFQEIQHKAQGHHAEAVGHGQAHRLLPETSEAVAAVHIQENQHPHHQGTVHQRHGDVMVLQQQRRVGNAEHQALPDVHREQIAHHQHTPIQGGIDEIEQFLVSGRLHVLAPLWAALLGGSQSGPVFSARTSLPTRFQGLWGGAVYSTVVMSFSRSTSQQHTAGSAESWACLVMASPSSSNQSRKKKPSSGLP